MDTLAAKSYYVGYDSIDRFLSIVFIHNYLLTWAIALITSLILPLLFILAPSSLRTTRSSYFLMICIVCLANLFCLYAQIYMVSGSGEPKLSYHTCRFVVYISTFAKPIGIYCTCLFGIERFVQKILPRLNIRRQLFQRLFQLFIFLGLISIVSIRLYEVIKLIPKSQSSVKPILDDVESDINTNSIDENITFQFCFQSVNTDAYARILSFYVIQYWFEYTALIIIILIFIIIMIQQCRLPTSSSRFSINTKFYLSLSICFILSELILLVFHFIVDDYKKRSTDVQLISLKIMLFIFNFRCIGLPLVICLTICDPFKKFFYELIILRPYVDNIDENDDTSTTDHHLEAFSSPQRTRNRLQRKFRTTLTKNNQNNNNNNEHLDQNESQNDL